MTNCIKSFMMITSIILEELYMFPFNVLQFAKTAVNHYLFKIGLS